MTLAEMDQLTDRLIADLFIERDPITLQDPDLFKVHNDTTNPIQLPDQKIQKDPQVHQWIAVHQCDPTVTMLLVCLSIRTGVGLFLSSDRDPVERSDHSLISTCGADIERDQSISDLFGTKDPVQKRSNSQRSG